MFSRKLAVTAALLVAVTATAALRKQERVIAGSPADSLEVRHLVLRGTNEEIGRALADIAQERYNVSPVESKDPLRTRAQRRYFESAYPIFAERMRGVAASFGHRPDDDTWNNSMLGFTDLRAGCSIVHLPRSATANGESVVSRDYDYSTGNLTFGFLPPGMLHPNARPYLLELHPDRGYASISMVAFDLLSGTLDGMNSEGLVVAMAMDDELFAAGKIEPTRGAAPGLGVLQTMRMLLDTCANVDEAKEALLRTKQYYEYIPVHYLIADRSGKSFVWEYSEFHNQEYIIENPGKPLVITNFALHKHMDGSNPPTPELARATCGRYAYLSEKLAATPSGITEAAMRAIHEKVDAAAPATPDQKRPPVRTFWHAFYYPERRVVKLSYYLHDDGPKMVRTDYLEFKLDPTNAAAPMSSAAPAVTSAAAPPKPAEPLAAAEVPIAAKLKAAGVTVQVERGHVVSVGFPKDSDPAPLLPLLRDLPRLNYIRLAETNTTDETMALLEPLTGLTGINLSSTKITDAGLVHLKTMGRMTKVNLAKTAVTDAGVAAAKKFLPFWATILR